MKKIVCCAFIALFVVIASPVRASTSTTFGLAPTDREFTRLVVGDGHTCVLLHNGAVRCWGDNTYGQLGVPTIASSKVPVTVSSFGANRFAVELAAGKNHTCALLNDASISCWGHNGYGALGAVSAGGYLPQNITAVQFSAVTAGGFNTCAISISRTTFCWGRNNLKQVGTQTQTSNVTSPQSSNHPSSVEGFVSVSTGENHSCAISTVGSSWCWGSNSDGQLGIGELSTSSYPVATYLLPNLQKVTILESGGSHSCLLTTQGNLICWGLNDVGQVGDTQSDTGTVPHYIENVKFLKVALGTRHTCGLKSGGNIVCWGDNELGQLGNSSTLSSSVPVVAQLPEGATAREIATGDSHTCALLDNDDVMCWGSNSKGKLGDGSTTQRLVPTKVVQLHVTPSESINTTSGITHNGATISAEFSTTDISSHRVLEYGTNEFLSGETSIIDLGHFGSVRQIATGSHHSCMVIAGGYVKCWGDNSDGALGTGDDTSHAQPTDVKDLSGQVRVVAVGWSHSCAVMSLGTVKCWGDNSSGQLGDGTVQSRRTPVTASISGVVDVVLGDGFTCALSVGGTVSCWGVNTDGQLGRTGSSSLTPSTVEVDGDHSVTSLSASSSRVCAVLSNATVKCWGEDITGIASPGTFASTVATVATGERHACATLHNGNIQCWGDDSQGQLGNGALDSSGSLVTSTLDVGDRAVATRVASDTSCALLSNGKVKCWGDGTMGVTGFGVTSDVYSPALVPELDAVVQLSLAELHGCALLRNGEVSCWGSNARQQRGTHGSAITAPEMMASQIHANVSTALTGLDDDRSYFYRVITTSSGGSTAGSIHTFNTTELPVAPPIDDTPTETPDDVPAQIPPNLPPPGNPIVDNAPNTNRPPLTQITPAETTTSGTQEKVTTVGVAKRRPSVKIGSLTRVRFLLRKLDFTVPKPTSETKMWMTVLNKRICRVYGDRLWAIRKGTCQLMVLKMSPSRRLTMSRTQIKVVR